MAEGGGEVSTRPVVSGITIAKIKAGQPDKYPDRMAAIYDGLRLAGLEEG